MATPATASLAQPFPAGRWGKIRFLEPPSIPAVTQLGCMVTRLCFPLGLLRELLWPVPPHPPETSPGLPGATQPGGRRRPAALLLPRPHAALAAPLQEHRKGGLCPPTPPFLSDDPMYLRPRYQSSSGRKASEPLPRWPPAPCARAATVAKDASCHCSARLHAPIAALAEVLNRSNSNSLGFIMP